MEEELATDYSEFLKVDLKSELHVVEDTIDEMLTRLDEFENLLSMVRADSASCTEIAIPNITAVKPKLEQLFGRVERLDALVTRVEADLLRVDDAVTQAENDLSGPSSGKLKALLKPLFFKGTTERTSKKMMRQTPSCDVDTLYSTEDFFPSEPGDEEEGVHS